MNERIGDNALIENRGIDVMAPNRFSSPCSAQAAHGLSFIRRIGPA